MKRKLLCGYALFLMLGLSTLQAQTQIGSDIVSHTTDHFNIDDQFGNAIALSSDGKIMAIGSAPSGPISYGKVKVFRNTDGDWTQIGSDLTGQGTPYATNYQSGKSVALSADGSVLAIGVPYYSGPHSEKQYAGGVRLLKNNGDDIWTEIGYILGEKANDNSGGAIALSADGNTVAIGATANKGSINAILTGHVRVYQNIAGVWTQIGNDIDGQSGYNYFGGSVAISADGSIVAAGASYDGGTQTGNVKVFKITDGVWNRIGTKILGEDKNISYDVSVSLSGDGNTLAIGDSLYPLSGTNSYAGHVTIYYYNSGDWNQIGQDIIGESMYDASGQSVSLSADGTIVAIGAPGNEGSGNKSGHVRIYQKSNNEWIKRGVDIDGKAGNELFGNCVSLSGNGKVVAIGAPPFNNSAEKNGVVRAYDISNTLTSDSFVTANTSIYPNPVKNNLYINLQQDLNIKEVNIYSVLGQLIKTENSHVINVSNLDKGFYLVQVITDKGNATHKILVE